MLSLKKITSHPRASEQGIALPTIIIFVLLTMLMALGASRTALFNELLVGNDVDYQRAYEAAQALVQDAELDIRGERADGSACKTDSDAKICRTGDTSKIPLEEIEVGPLIASLNQQTLKCHYALCVKRTDKQDFWNNSDESQGTTLDQMTSSNIGARYGEYTGAKAATTSNPILADTTAGRGGWYWIEVLPYDAAAGNSALITNGSTNLALNLKPNVVYRITALAYGRKPTKTGSMVVLQQTYARQVRRD